MYRKSIFLILVFSVIPTVFTTAVTVSDLKQSIIKLHPLQMDLDEPKFGEWRYHHDDPEQRFDHYLETRPTIKTSQRHTIYLSNIGDFNEEQDRIFSQVKEYMNAFFQMKIKVLKNIKVEELPKHAKRINSYTGNEQLNSIFILNNTLRKRLPSDASALLCLSAKDLWPGNDWNFVFGQASIQNRVGVWSIFRFGDPELGNEEFTQCFRRTIKTALHETCHMFSLRHCVIFSCLMGGSNSLEESDERPIHLCSECNAKLCYATQADPIERYLALLGLCKTLNWENEITYYSNAASLLKGDRN